MTGALKKDSKLNAQDPEYIFAFEKLKQLISEDPFLKILDLKKQIVLTTDASNVALGPVLSQDGQLH